MVTTRLFRPGDLEGITFRAEDEAESLAASGVSCRDAIHEAHQRGAAIFTAETPERPIAFFGVSAGLIPQAASVWLLGSEALFSYRRELVSLPRGVLHGFHRSYPLLFNYVDARNTAHIRWLRHLGFSFLRRIESYGVGGLPFYEFARLHHV